VENLCQYIEKLLVLHDYVVVPNFGGFVVQQQSSRIFGDKITAPRATIGFNPLLQYGDGLLAIEISHSKKITYRQAMDFIHKEVEELKQKIEKKEVIKVTKIGYFQKDNSENIIFTPDEEANFLPQNFCLPDLFISAKSYKTTEKDL
jgi:nucleoid DNA-binding protein